MSTDNIKTIIFDFGGVVFTSGSVLVVKKIATNYDIGHPRVSQIFKDKKRKLGYELRAGNITMEKFLESTGNRLGLTKKDREIIKLIWFNSYVPHFGMFELLEKLKKKYRLVVFSGNIKERVEFLDNRYDMLKYFDAQVWSYDYHYNKDQIEFYQELLKHINCEPEEALLIDDDKRTVIIAKAVGLNALIYYYPDKLIEDLRELNVIID